MKNTITMVGLCFILFQSVLCFAESDIINPVNTTNEAHPFVQLLKNVWETRIRAVYEGDLEAYKKVRTNAVLSKENKYLTDEYFSSRKGKDAYDINLEDDPGFKFIRCDFEGNTARLSYKYYHEDFDQLDYHIRMFYYEDGHWKSGRGIVKAYSLLNDKMGNPTVEDAIKSRQYLQLKHEIGGE